MKSTKLCKVVNMAGELVLAEENVTLSPTELLIKDLSQKFDSIEELLSFIEQKYKIEIK